MLGEVMTIARRLGGCLLTCFVPLACEQAQLRSGAHRVDLAIAKSANLAVAQEGDAIVYTVNVTNYGAIIQSIWRRNVRSPSSRGVAHMAKSSVEGC